MNRRCWEWAKDFGLAMTSDPNLDPLTPVDILRSPLDEPNFAAASEGGRRVPLQHK